MKTTGIKILFASMLFSGAVPSVLFSSEKEETEPVNQESKLRVLLIKICGFEYINKSASTIQKNGEEELRFCAHVHETSRLKDIKALLDNKVDINAQDEIGHTTALIVAVNSSNYEVIKLLCECKADLSLTNLSHKTARDLASEKKIDKISPEIFALLTNDPVKN